MPPSVALRPAPPDSIGESIRILSYTTSDSLRHEVNAEVTAVGPDSLRFVGYGTSLEFMGGEWPEPGAQPFVMARADVLSLEKRRVSPVVRDACTLLCIVGIGLAIHGMLELGNDGN